LAAKISVHVQPDEYGKQSLLRTYMTRISYDNLFKQNSAHLERTLQQLTHQCDGKYGLVAGMLVWSSCHRTGSCGASLPCVSVRDGSVSPLQQI